MANNARNAAKTAVSNATKAAKQPTTTNKAGQQGRILEDTKPAKIENVADFVGRYAKVTAGRKYLDEVVGVYYVAAEPNKWGQRTAMAELNGETVFVNSKYLEDTGKKMDPKLLKSLQDARENAANETIYVAANARYQNDTSIRLRGIGWFADVWFRKDKIATTDAVFSDEKSTPIYEVPLWMVRRHCGEDTLNAELARQDEYTKLVNAG